MNVKKIALLVLLISVLATGLVFAQINIITEESAYAHGLYAGYTTSSIVSPFSDPVLTSAWRRGYLDGQNASSQQSVQYSISASDYASLFPARNNAPTSSFSQRRLGISWSPIFKFNSKEYIFGPDGVYEYTETALGLRATLVIRETQR